MLRVTDKHITSELAVRTLQKALDSQHPAKGGLLLHSDQGSQYTSKAFIEFCEYVHVAQSMSKAGYPYDNAPMERYFNTLKNECTKLYEFRTDIYDGAIVPYIPVPQEQVCEVRTPFLVRPVCMEILIQFVIEYFMGLPCLCPRSLWADDGMQAQFPVHVFMDCCLAVAVPRPSSQRSL